MRGSWGCHAIKSDPIYVIIILHHYHSIIQCSWGCHAIKSDPTLTSFHLLHSSLIQVVILAAYAEHLRYSRVQVVRGGDAIYMVEMAPFLGGDAMLWILGFRWSSLLGSPIGGGRCVLFLNFMRLNLSLRCVCLDGNVGCFVPVSNAYLHIQTRTYPQHMHKF